MAITRRTALLGAATLLMPPVLPARADGVSVVGGPAFGSYWRLTLPGDAAPAAAVSTVTRIVSWIDDAMSPYRATSDLSRFNAARTTDWIGLPVPVCSLVRVSTEVASQTGGAFDPTVGPLVSRFGFGPIRDGSTTGSYRELEVGDGVLRKSIPDLTIDLCGIAKGYALDKIATALVALGSGNFLLELGGEVVVRGVHPSGRPWQVGVERPGGPPALAHVVRPDGLALATSGDAIQSYRVASRLYTHVIDPWLRQPVDGSIASVTVLMPTGTEADAYATALMAMGAGEAIAFAQRRSIPALFQLWVAGELSEQATGGFGDSMIA